MRIRIEFTQDFGPDRPPYVSVVEMDVAETYSETVEESLVALRAAVFAAFHYDRPEVWDMISGDPQYSGTAGGSEGR